MISEDVRHILEPELEVGEELIWADKCRVNGIRFYDVLSLLLIFALIGVFFSNIEFKPLNPFRSMIGVENGRITPLKTWLQIPFRAFFPLLVLWQIRALFSHKHEYYGLTEKRLIVLINFWPNQKMSFPLDHLKKVKTKKHSIFLWFFQRSGVLFSGYGYELYGTKNQPDLLTFLNKHLSNRT